MDANHPYWEHYSAVLAACASSPAAIRAKSIRDAGAAGDVDLIQDLLGRPDTVPREWSKAPSCAAAADQRAMMRFLLGHGASIDEDVVAGACKSASVAVFQVLLENGSDVSARHSNATVLRWMVGEQAVVEWLLDHGADPCLGTPVPSRAREAAPLNPRSGDVLNAAAAVSSVAVFKLLLARGARLDWSTPLHAAAALSSTDRIPMMAFLLELGVDVNSYNPGWPSYHGTPLDEAVMSPCPRKARFLMQNGADPHIKNHWGNCAFEVAQNRGYREMLKGVVYDI
ncbi:MAG: hypothetical protein M1832_004704 [Thelocarpon impressellum]|nr:MAG: hypothetical protein M1832_004704 [Thelocarpon impressellum]